MGEVAVQVFMKLLNVIPPFYEVSSPHAMVIQNLPSLELSSEPHVAHIFPYRGSP